MHGLFLGTIKLHSFALCVTSLLDRQAQEMLLTLQPTFAAGRLVTRKRMPGYKVE